MSTLTLSLGDLQPLTQDGQKQSRPRRISFIRMLLLQLQPLLLQEEQTEPNKRWKHFRGRNAKFQ
ncbi:hypothetical protein Mapa_013225 [Marchantia paleacea]|nr:hypothetical protein Mapa_013225 [Marchantia paleacea]